MLASSYATYVFFGNPHTDETHLSLGSAFVVEQQGVVLVVTADHVVAAYLAARESDVGVVFQVGNHLIDVESRLVLRDSVRDVACVRIDEADITRIGVNPYRASNEWPSVAIAPGDYVQYCGFPAFYRRDIGRLDVSVVTLTGFVKVASVGEGFATCQIEREYLVQQGPEPIPPAGTRLGGMSGGPVLLRGVLEFPIVGLVSEFAENLDILRLSIFDWPLVTNVA